MKRIAVIGAGISGLSAAAYSAKAGAEVHVFEKNSTPGGRARQLKTENGYTFDMGPSWYWMPDIIEGFFQDFGCSSADFYELVSLNPQFEMVFAQSNMNVPADMEALVRLFDEIEPGAGPKLEAFMEAAREKYQIGMQDLVNKPCHSWWEFISFGMTKNALKLDLFTNFRKYVKKYFSHPQLVALMEFPVIFLGASPVNIPALYSLMNYGGIGMGTWYPMGGFYKLVEAMYSVAAKVGVQFHFDSEVQRIKSEDGSVHSLIVNGQPEYFDAVIASSDYHHTETLLEAENRNYSQAYWKSRTFAPSCLIYYLGFREKIAGLQHHTLFFEPNLDNHIREIYQTKTWPQDPLFYCCCPGKTDPSVAPEGHENLFLLMPLAIDIEDTPQRREEYLHRMLGRLEKHTGVTGLAEKIDYKHSYCASDFQQDYNAYGGNAYGLANTLLQTAVLKPSIRNKKIHNLFYTGQLTVPGPGVPPSIISGKVVAQEAGKIKLKRYEKAV